MADYGYVADLGTFEDFQADSPFSRTAEQLWMRLARTQRFGGRNASTGQNRRSTLLYRKWLSSIETPRAASRDWIQCVRLLTRVILSGAKNLSLPSARTRNSVWK